MDERSRDSYIININFKMQNHNFHWMLLKLNYEISTGKYFRKIFDPELDLR